MFDPSKLVMPLDNIVNVANERVRKLLIDENNVIVKKVDAATGYFNTVAIVDNVDTDGRVTRSDREIQYDRVDVGLFADSIAIETKDIYGVTNKNIVTDYVTQTNPNPVVEDLVTLFNDEYKCPIGVSDLIMVPRTQITGRDTSFGQVYKDVNCKISTNSVLYTGGNIVVHQRSDTYPFSYNKIATSKPGFMVYRDWAHSEILEITLPEVESITQSGWELMFEDVNSTQQLGNGDLWFKIKHDSSASKWIYESINGTQIEVDASSLVKVKINIVEGMLTVECLTFVNNNAYESVGIDEVTKLSQTRGLQRITCHSINPNPTLFNLKVKVTQNEVATEAGITVNDKSYDYTYNQLQASATSNATLGLVDKNIIITCYNVVNYAESTLLDTFIATTPAQRGVIQSFDKFPAIDGHGITFKIKALESAFTDGTISSVCLEYADRYESTNSVRVLLKNPKLSEVGLTLSAECYVKGTLIEIKEVTLNAESPMELNGSFNSETLKVALGDDVMVMGQISDDRELQHYVSTLTVVPTEAAVLPVVSVAKSNSQTEQ